MRSISTLVVLLMVLMTMSPESGAAGRITIGESGDSWIDLGLLGQLHFSYSDELDVSTDFFLRRGRIILSGQIMDGIKFFVETDNDNAGKNGGAAVGTDIQDAFVDFRFIKNHKGEAWVKAGLVLLPFSFENRSSAAGLLGIDYNVEAIKLPNSFVWRDYGIEFHGNITDKFAFFVGVFDGYDEPNSTKSPEAEFRFTGHIAVNVLGKAENGWFFSQERLGKQGHYLSLGFGIDRQGKATRMEDSRGYWDVDSEAWVADLQSGFVFSPISITLNAGYYDYDNATFEGNTMFTEAGLMYSRFMLSTKYNLVEPEEGDCAEDFTAGLHYFIKDHRARLGVEYRWGDSPETVLLGIQIFP